MAVVSMKSLLESGVHFGHRTHRWNPRMKPYIFTERNGIHIINLQLTVKALNEAHDLISATVADGGKVLFVGTKRQAQETIQIEAMRCSMPYVNARWLGGMLTNHRTIRERINELERLERMRDSGEFERLTKKEGLMLTRKIEKLETRLSGTRNMVGLPELLFVVDVRREETAIHEANLLEIPVIAMVDTNCDPRDIDYIIPSNDDAIRAIKLIVSKIADAVLEGKALREEGAEEEVYEPYVATMIEEPELSDEELLGEATLAKLRDAEAVAADKDEQEKGEEGPETDGDEEEAPEAELEEEPREEEMEEDTAGEPESADVEPVAEEAQVEEPQMAEEQPAVETETPADEAEAPSEPEETPEEAEAELEPEQSGGSGS